MTLLMTSVFVLTANISVQAQDEAPPDLQSGDGDTLPQGVTPDFTVESTAYLSFRPKLVGVDQTVLINMWITPALHSSRRFIDYTVTLTKPDGTKDIIGPITSYHADTTAWFEYTVDQVGEWTLKFDVPGGYFPAGNYRAYRGGEYLPGAPVRSAAYTYFEDSCYYAPSSTEEQRLIVQDEQVLSWPASELPTDYWTRPVPFEHREWWPILGNYPWHGIGGGPEWPADTSIYWGPDQRFTPWVQGPENAHIAWKRQGDLGGLLGGDFGTEAFLYRNAYPRIIYGGRAYQTFEKPSSTEPSQTHWQCYDIRTGEVYWERPLFPGESAPTVIEYDKRAASVPGAEGQSAITISLLRIGSRLLKYDPFTGRLVANLTGMSGTYYKNSYVLSVQNLGGGNYRLINWTTGTTYDDFSMRVVSNITWPWSNLGTSQDFEAGIAARTDTVTPDPVGAWYGTRFMAADMKTGTELWDITIDDSIYSSSASIADHGKIAAVMRGGYYLAYDLRTGNLAWKSEVMDYPWSQAAFGGYTVQSAYGMLYWQTYSGIYAWDWDDGSIVWKYEAPSANSYETPYTGKDGTGVYSFDSHANIADGKMYVLNNEHTPTAPITRGWGLHCIDAYTGEGIWNITGVWSWGEPGPIADGYIAVCSSDGYQYVFGKGQSETTVSAPQTSVPKGVTVLITGTVTDQSPGQPGTPCVSADSMETQMNYLHMQMPIDGVWHNRTITGVPVTLTAIDKDGNYIDIGTTTTSGYYGTFAFAWTPTTEGTYEIVASFAGDDSYGSSGAASAVVVGPAVSPDVPIEPVTEEPLLTTVAIIAAVAVVAVIGVVAYWALKKRK